MSVKVIVPFMGSGTRRLKSGYISRANDAKSSWHRSVAAHGLPHPMRGQHEDSHDRAVVERYLYPR